MAKLPRRRPPDLRVREARPEDRPALLAMWRELLAFHATLHPSYRLAAGAPEALAATLDRELRDPRSVLLVAHGAARVGRAPPEADRAEGDDVPAGFCVARRVEGPPETREAQRGSLDELWVRPGARRRGAGRRLVAAALGALATAGCARVEVRVLAANDGARAFWRAQGFAPYVEVLEWSGQRD